MRSHLNYSEGLGVVGGCLDWSGLLALLLSELHLLDGHHIVHLCHGLPQFFLALAERFSSALAELQVD